MAPKHVLMLHHLHDFIVNVQPRFPAAAVPITVKHVDRVVPTACRLAAMVKYPMKLVVYLLRRLSRYGCHDLWTDREMSDS